MANDNGKQTITWRTVVDALKDDTELATELTASISATELPARSPAALYLAERRNLEAAGIDPDEALDVLPEPWSNQEKKVNGLNVHVTDNERAIRDANPEQYWDKYKYKPVTKPGQIELPEISGSVYSDMAARHPLGHQIKEQLKLIEAWSSNDTVKSTLQQTMVFNGVELDMGGTPDSRLLTMKSTLSQRFNKLAENFRVMSGIHRNIREIQEKMSDHVRVEFVYATEYEPESGLTPDKAPIRVCKLRPDGVPSGKQQEFVAKTFANLWVDQAIEKAGEKGDRYLALVDSRKIKQKLTGKGGSTKEKGKAEVEGRVNVGNLLSTVGDNIGEWIDSFDTMDKAVAAATKKLGEMTTDVRILTCANAVAIRDFYNAFVTKDMESVAFAQDKIKRERAQKELADRLKADSALKDAETQPTQHQRNAALQLAQDAEAQAALAAMDAAEKLRARVQDKPRSAKEPSAKPRSAKAK